MLEIIDFLTRVIRNVDNWIGNITKNADSIVPEPYLSLSVNISALIANIWLIA
jgi:hypothetical protein